MSEYKLDPRSMLRVQVQRIVEEALAQGRPAEYKVGGNGSEKNGATDNIDDASSGHLVGIVGERGSGKTTLLAGVIASLSRANTHIVAPVIRPEMLGASESILVSTISFLSHLPTTASDLFTDDDQRAEITELAQRALRAAIYMSHDPVNDLLSRSGSLGQFAADTAAILYRTADLRADLAELVSKILAFTKRAAVVVSIDDIDLSPGRLTQLLFDVRILGACDGVIPIACLSMADLRANLRAELARSFPSMDRGSLDRSVAQQVMKTLRPDRIFEPLQLPRGDRLEYAPLGASRH